MKKNIIIIFLVLTNLSTIIYGMVQLTRNQVIAMQNKEMVKQARAEAELNVLRANASADSTRVAQERAELEKRRAEKIMEELQIAKLEIEKCK